MPTSRVFAGLATSVMLILAVGACGDDGSGEAAPDRSSDETAAEGEDLGPIIIGFPDEKSGPTASVQGIAGNGVRRAVEVINAEGGIDGREIQLIERDTEGDATTTVRGIQEMVAEGATAIVGPVNGALCQAVAPTLAELEVPGICLSPVDLPAETDWMFGIGTELAQQDELLFELLGEVNGKVGIVSQKTPVLDLINAHIEEHRPEGVDIQVQEVEPTDTTARAQLEALIADDVGGILLAPCGPLTVTAAHEAVDLGFEGDMFVWNCWASEQGAQAMADIAEGRNIFTVAPTFQLPPVDPDDPQAEAIQEFVDAGGPQDNVDVVGWDGVHLLAQAIEAAGSADPDAILATLEDDFAFTGAYTDQVITAEDHRGASEELILVRFTPEATMERVEEG